MKILVLLIVGFLVRFFAFLFIDFSFENDVLTFQAWAIHLHRLGFSAFYEADIFTDYPPVYMYFLYILGLIRSFFEWPVLSPVFNFLTFLPAMLADLVIGFIIYWLGAKKDEDFALIISGAWVFNPSVILVSGVWGQVESVFVVLLFVSLILLRERKLLPAYILFGIAILTKPQSLFLGPVYLYSALSYFNGGFNKKSALYLAGSIIGAVFVMVLISLPFGLANTLDIFISGAGLRGFASVNAFNFWAFFGANWQPWELTIWGFSYLAWGVAIIAAVIIGALAALHIDSTKHGGKFFYLIVAFLFVVIFVFSVRMHERYLFPALLFLLVYYLEHRDRRVFWLYAGFSITFYVNCLEVLRWLRGGGDLSVFDVSLPIISFANIVLGFITIWLVVDGLRVNKKEIVVDNLTSPPPMLRRDWVLISVLVVVYSFVAFVNLGNVRSPQTMWESSAESNVVFIDFGEMQWVSRFQYMMGSRHDRGFSLLHRGSTIYETTGGDVFAWHEAIIESYAQQLILFTPPNEYGLRLQEIAFRDADDELIEIYSISETALTDEQHLVPDYRRFRNSTIFDEIYHPRTGYEYLHGLPVFETTHPPMGKNFIAMSVAVFGMTPFGWRFPGTFFGVLMIPLIYAFARQLLKSNNDALFAAFIFTFDFMHFTQTRLATIDTYVVFFVMAMYFFMYLYVNGVEKYSLRRSLILLGLCGVCMGLAIASKWQGVYGAIGLPLLFFPALFKLHAINTKHAWITFASCFGFFVGIPIVIYMLSYIPFVLAQGGGVAAIWNNQLHMFSYHSELVAEHPFASNWWSWPFMLRPIWLYVTRISPEISAGKTSFGNPAIWWLGIVFTFFVMYILAKKRGKEPDIVFLLVAYAAQFLPWIFVDRLTFIYHYFPSVPFVVLIIAWVFKNHVKNTKIALVYCGVVLGLFMLFFPVLSGLAVNRGFVHEYLRWLPGWVLL